MADFQGMFAVPENFEPTAAFYNPSLSGKKRASPPQIIINPQTALLCEMLALTDPFAVFSGRQSHSMHGKMEATKSVLDDSAMADDSSLASDDDPPTFIDSTLECTLNTTSNPDEISLEDDDDEEEKVEAGSEKKVVEPKASSPLDDRLAVAPDSPPITQLEHTASLCSASPIKNTSPLGKRTPEHPIDTTESESAATTDDCPSPLRLKKFKRRNQAYYASTEEEN